MIGLACEFCEQLGQSEPQWGVDLSHLEWSHLSTTPPAHARSPKWQSMGENTLASALEFAKVLGSGSPPPASAPGDGYVAFDIAGLRMVRQAVSHACGLGRHGREAGGRTRSESPRRSTPLFLLRGTSIGRRQLAGNPVHPAPYQPKTPLRAAGGVLVLPGQQATPRPTSRPGTAPCRRPAPPLCDGKAWGGRPASVWVLRMRRLCRAQGVPDSSTGVGPSPPPMRRGIAAPGPARLWTQGGGERCGPCPPLRPAGPGSACPPGRSQGSAHRCGFQGA